MAYMVILADLFGRPAPAWRGSALALTLLSAGALTAPPLAAKTPGQVHCYGKVCHRVLNVQEVQARVGRGFVTETSYYDSAENDRFNVGLITSSGEVFDASSPYRVASSIYPDGTELLLWNPRNGRASHVRVNDFGPFYAQRTLDVTRRIAEDMGFAERGVTQLMVVVVAAPSPSEARYRRGRSYATSYGYIGRFTGEDLDDLSADLIAAAQARRADEIAAGSPPAAPNSDGKSTAGQVAATAAPAAPERSGVADPLAKAHRVVTDWIYRATLLRAEHALGESSSVTLATAMSASRHAPSAGSRVAALPVGAAPGADAGAPNSPQAQLSHVTERAHVTAVVAAPARVAEAAPPLAIRASAPVEVLSAAAPLPTVVTQAVEVSRRAPHVTGFLDAIGEQVRALQRHAQTQGWPQPKAWSLWLSGLLIASSLILLMRDARDRRQRRRAVRIGTGEAGRMLAAADFAAESPTEPGHLPGHDLDPAAAPAAAGARPAAEALGMRRPHEAVAPLLPAAASSDLAATAHRLAGEERHAEAEQVLTQLIGHIEATEGPQAPSLAGHLCAWADCARELGRHADAMSIYARALAIAEMAGDLQGAAEILDARALLALRQRQPEAALEDANRALAKRSVWMLAGAPEVPADPDYGVTLSILGEAHRVTDNLAAAEAAHRQALGAFLASDGARGLRTAGSMTSLARVLVAATPLRPAATPAVQGARNAAVAEARTLLLTALPVLEEHLGLRHPGVAQSRATLADVHQAIGDVAEAVRLRRHALDILETVGDAAHPDVIEARQRLVALIAAPMAAAAE